MNLHLPPPTVTLKPDQAASVWAGHPWVRPSSIAHVRGGARPGDEVAVVDAEGRKLGRGLYSPQAPIAVRLFSRHTDQPFDGAFLRNRLQQALALRRTLHLPTPDTDAFRLVHAEGDGLPGLIVDRFGDTGVVQFTTLGMKLRQGMIIEALQNELGLAALVDRTAAADASAEGFEAGSGVLRGPESAATLRFVERGLRYELPPELDPRTSFYFDQRVLRARVEQLARGRRVLDACCFVGSFALAAARGGASEVVAVDQGLVALDIGAITARANGLDERVRFQRDTPRNALRRVEREGGYDLVLCDLPRLTPGPTPLDELRAAYRQLAAHGCRATRPGGLLVLCACSSQISLDHLTRALALGAAAAGRSALVLERGSQGADHPVPAAFPEGLSLKSLLARIDLR